MVEINQFKENEFNRISDVSKKSSHELSEFIKRIHDLENALQYIINLSHERANAAESVHQLTGNQNYEKIKDLSRKEIKQLTGQLEDLKKIFSSVAEIFKREDEIETFLGNIADAK